jgi:hypothetical protein
MRFGLALLAVAGALAPRVVAAQDARAELERARAHAASADFPAALEAFDRAYAGDGLPRGELPGLLLERALVRSALGDASGAEADLARLLRVDPGHELPASVQPALAARFAALRALIEPPTFELDVRDESDARVVVEARTRGAGDLVREVVVETRIDGGAWASSRRERTTVETEPGAVVEIRARWIGPGGAVVASRGDAPIEHTVPSARGGDDAPVIVGVTLGVAAAIGVGVAIALAVVLAPAGESGTQLAAPVIEW